MKQHRAYGEKWDAETRAYFDSLPVFLQESIMQSGVKTVSRPGLQALAEELKRRK